METTLRSSIALGIADEDRKKGPEPKYFANYSNQIKKEHNLLLKKHTSAEQFLIIICPEIESWLNENAISVNVLPSDYGLPGNFTGFIRRCKSQDIRKNFQFDNFIKALLRKEAPGLLTFKTWLEAFLANKDLL